MPSRTITDCRAGGCIVLLDLPPSSSITLDGITRITPSSLTTKSTLNRDLFIVNNVPTLSLTSSNDDFHLLVVRCGIHMKSRSHVYSGKTQSLPVGFVLSSINATHTFREKKNEHLYDWVFARKYDPQTEEISNESLNELTMSNLMLAITSEDEEFDKFRMSYDQFMGSSSARDSKNISAWKAHTSLITSTYLQKIHGVFHGDKIVPSTYASSCDDLDYASPMNVGYSTVDGKSITYPSIPCIDSTLSTRQLTQHAGTKSYLSKLSPNLRTLILSGGDCNIDRFNDEFSCAEEYIWNHLLQFHYSKEGKVETKGENDFLADVQFSFLLFLFMECHSSLVHWRDSVSMCSLTAAASSKCHTSSSILQRHPFFFIQLMSIMYDQVSYIESDFFEDEQYTAVNGNFFLAAIERLCNACGNLNNSEMKGDSMKQIQTTSLKLQMLMRDRFDIQLSTSLLPMPMEDNDIECNTDVLETGDDDGLKFAPNAGDMNNEDSPVVVPWEEVEASLERLEESQKCGFLRQTTSNEMEMQHHRDCYPLLYAAMTPQEDLVMACARILDVASDVSLVREAAAYLEEVESHQKS